MSRFAGSGGVAGNRNYPTATMNDLVYPVHGGMEDWGYGASWDKAYVRPCTPRANGGYSSSKTVYGDGAARAFTVLVETSDAKRPADSTLGGEAGVYHPLARADGHVPRNMRLALATIDLLQPHVHAWVSKHPPRSGCIHVQWQVWGAVTVDESQLQWRAWTHDSWRLAGFVLDNFASPAQSQSGAHDGSPATGSLLGGDGVWGGVSSPLAPYTLSACAHLPPDALSQGATSGKLELAVRVRADSGWVAQPGGTKFAPNVPPQSHLARARANDSYVSVSGVHRVLGHAFWWSEPITMQWQG